MELLVDGNRIEFEQVLLIYKSQNISNIFTRKNNKNLLETLSHKKYEKLSVEVENKYSQFLYNKLGDFLQKLKLQGDNYYLNFLNKYGDKIFCHFIIEGEVYLNKKGLYIYTLQDNIVYIGRCRDSFKKRINQGYGKIYPKNCFIDGQATNCHLNSLISENIGNVKLWICPMTDNNLIETTEVKLIAKLNPLWNIALKQNNNLQTN